MNRTIRIGTRDSQLAVWQAETVQQQLEAKGYAGTLIKSKSEGDIDLQTPLYRMGVQGIFTRHLDIALLNNQIDIAVHSMKDVPVDLPKGIVQAAVLKRHSYKDLLVFGEGMATMDATAIEQTALIIGTSSVRRKAQWLHRYPLHQIENLRGNVNTRLRKLQASNWYGAIFAAAGLERINLRPANSIELDWMLPAPAQGALMVVCRADDHEVMEACAHLNDTITAACTKIERDFLSGLMGGCSTPISALAEYKDGHYYFKGNIVSADGKEKIEVELNVPADERSVNTGIRAAEIMKEKGALALT